MIKEIKELNFPKIGGKQYATLTAATVTLQDMGEKNITSTVKIDGDITPDFSYDWAVEFQGEKYIMPLRKPQGAKEDVSMSAGFDLTFQHWAIYWLKQKFFFDYVTSEAGTVTPDKFIVPLQLNLKDFCDYLSNVCEYWYGGKITVSLNPDWEYSDEKTLIDISYSYVWDVLIKLYELYAVRWVIVPDEKIDHYVIKIGYPTTEVNHIFQYGFEGGLLKVEQQVQDESIRNIYYGRGGSKNLPYRYFKKHDEQNAAFSPDPDWIPELADIPFTELHGATFRSYIQGWKAKHYPTETITTPTSDKAYAPWAWMRGNTDTKFDPVEFVADEFTTAENGYGVKPGSSIAEYGELMGGLSNNEDIYPTIQGLVVNPYGRIDECVAVEEIKSDDVEQATENDATVTEAIGCKGTAPNVAPSGYTTITLKSNGIFKVEQGQHADLDVTVRVLSVNSDGDTLGATGNAEVTSQTLKVYNELTGAEHTASGIPGGTWRYEVTVTVHNQTLDKTLNITVGDNSPVLTGATIGDTWGATWDVWVKNIWQSAKKTAETNTQYAERVWGPILGDREGGEAKMVFTTGALAASSDYEFTIVNTPVYDTSKELDGVESHWRITLAKSDADMESLGVYVPSTKRQAIAGDKFVFIGIDMPHLYVVKAEERLDDRKKDELAKVMNIKPTWSVGLDKVRIHNHGEANALVDQLRIGNSLRLADKRFIQGDYEVLYLQSVTYTYKEPTEKEANLLPDVEIVLSDTYTTSANPVARLSGEINALQKQIGAISNIEQIVRAVGDKLYLRKDGISDRSISPTEFASLLTSVGFRNGIAGGQGWGFYKDENGNYVLETDRINVRQEMLVNSLVINQVEGRGGMTISSAALMKVTRVEDTDSGYVCYFDQKEGTVANLFKVNDVAYCQRFTPENASLKFYKRRVMEVGVDSITLTKGYPPLVSTDGTTDTGVNGNGIPEKDDTIIHYGNYTDKTRQYVKVSDVVGGGYERFIRGLDTVDATGREYFFVGMQSGMYEGKPRCFIGDAGEHYLEYANDKLKLKCDLSVESTIGGESIKDYTDSDPASVNLLLNSAFRQGLNHWLMWDGGKGGKVDNTVSLEGDPSIRLISSDATENMYYGIRQDAEIVSISASEGEWVTASIYAFTDNTASFDAWSGLEVTYFDADNNQIGATAQRISLFQNNKWERWHLTVQCPEDTASVGIKAYLERNGRLWLAHPMLAKGNKLSEWVNNSHDFNYITNALKESTTVSGGLVQTSRLEVGYTASDGTRVTTAGTNGIYSGEERGGGLAFFAGGNGLSEAATTFGIRMDGTGYAADHTLQFLKDALHVGENEEIRLNKLGLFLYDGDNIRLRISNTPVEFDPDIVGSPVVDINEAQLKGGLAYVNYPFFQSLNFDDLIFSTVTKGETFSINVSLSVNFTWAGALGYPRYPALKVVVLDSSNETIVETISTLSISQGMSKASIPIVFDAPVAGSYTVRTSIVNYNMASDSEPTQPCNANLLIQGTRSKTISNQTMIGNNGLCSIWNNYALAINDTAFIARVGRKAFRITNSAIEKNEGDGWVAL